MKTLLAILLGVLFGTHDSGPVDLRFPGEEAYPPNVVAVGADAAHRAGTTGRGVVVAVLDTGVDATHVEFPLGKVKAARDFSGRPEAAGTDPAGHGTHVAGIVAAARNEVGGIGVAPDARLLDARVIAWGDRGKTLAAFVADAIEWAVREDADVINMSFGSGRDHAEVAAALTVADAAGVILVASAGNDGTRPVGFPARHPAVIAVGAETDWSSRGWPVFCVAPGADVFSSFPAARGGVEARFSGTSMSAPHVSGLAALWVEKNRGVPKVNRPEAFRRALAQSCSGGPRNPVFGYGRPDAAKLIGVRP